jgi:Tfp pilus assembly protein PilE
MQKYISAIFMFLTLGGLGFWTFGDIVWALSGKFKDKYGLPINASKDLGALPTALIAIFLIFVVLFLIGMLLAVFIPAYQNYADEQRSEDARIAAFLVSAAEEEYYDSHSSYTDDYNALTSGNYLDMDDAIIYGPIKLYSQSYGDGYRPCYSFKTSLKRAPEYASDYDSCKDYDYNAGDDYGAGGDEW